MGIFLESRSALDRFVLTFQRRGKEKGREEKGGSRGSRFLAIELAIIIPNNNPGIINVNGGQHLVSLSPLSQQQLAGLS